MPPNQTTQENLDKALHDACKALLSSTTPNQIEEAKIQLQSLSKINNRGPVSFADDIPAACLLLSAEPNTEELFLSLVEVLSRSLNSLPVVLGLISSNGVVASLCRIIRTGGKGRRSVRTVRILSHFAWADADAVGAVPQVLPLASFLFEQLPLKSPPSEIHGVVTTFIGNLCQSESNAIKLATTPLFLSKIVRMLKLDAPKIALHPELVILSQMSFVEELRSGALAEEPELVDSLIALARTPSEDGGNDKLLRLVMALANLVGSDEAKFSNALQINPHVHSALRRMVELVERVIGEKQQNDWPLAKLLFPLRYCCVQQELRNGALASLVSLLPRILAFALKKNDEISVELIIEITSQFAFDEASATSLANDASLPTSLQSIVGDEDLFSLTLRRDAVGLIQSLSTFSSNQGLSSIQVGGAWSASSAKSVPDRGTDTDGDIRLSSAVIEGGEYFPEQTSTRNVVMDEEDSVEPPANDGTPRVERKAFPRKPLGEEALAESVTNDEPRQAFAKRREGETSGRFFRFWGRPQASRAPQTNIVKTRRAAGRKGLSSPSQEESPQRASLVVLRKRLSNPSQEESRERIRTSFAKVAQMESDDDENDDLSPPAMPAQMQMAQSQPYSAPETMVVGGISAHMMQPPLAAPPPYRSNDWPVGSSPGLAMPIPITSSPLASPKSSQASPPASPTLSKRTRVMVSYNWGVQETAIRITKFLRGVGFDVWIDVDNMSADLFTAMADAVQGSQAVFVLVTKPYRDSSNCRRECTFAAKLKKKIIPLCLREGSGELYTGDSWLGLITSDLLYYEIDIFDSQSLEYKLREVVEKELGGGGKVWKASEINSVVVRQNSERLNSTRIASTNQSLDLQTLMRSMLQGNGNGGSDNELGELFREEVRRLIQNELNKNLEKYWWRKGPTRISAQEIVSQLTLRGVDADAVDKLQKAGVDSAALDGLVSPRFDGVFVKDMFNLSTLQVLQLRKALLDE